MMRMMNQVYSDSALRDRRTQVRIRVEIPITLSLPGVDEPLRAINQNISWGGVLFVLSEPLRHEGGLLRITLPWKRGAHITAEARLLRARQLEDGRYLVAVRFVSLSPRSQSRLERLLQMLQTGETTAPDQNPGGLVKALEVTVNDAEELRRTLLHVAKGRHRVTVFDAYDRDQSISFSIVSTKDLPGIRLRARVLEVHKSRVKGFDWAELHALLLEFEHPRKALRACVKLLLDQLPKPPPSSGSQRSEEPDWLRTKSFPAPAGPGKHWVGGKRGLSSTLETEFPEALNYLTAGWGDVDAFEVLFQDLVLGEHGQPGGWPPDAWEELELLQSIHDQAYGLPESRKRLLKGGRSV